MHLMPRRRQNGLSGGGGRISGGKIQDEHGIVMNWIIEMK